MTAITKTLLVEDVEHEVEVFGTVVPYDPGVLSGPPEGCYPPEGGEVEDIGLTLMLHNGVVLNFDERDIPALAGPDWLHSEIDELREADDRERIAAQEERDALAEEAYEARCGR